MPCIYLNGSDQPIYKFIRYMYVFLAGKSPNIRSCTVYIRGLGQPYNRQVLYTLQCFRMRLLWSTL